MKTKLEKLENCRAVDVTGHDEDLRIDGRMVAGRHGGGVLLDTFTPALLNAQQLHYLAMWLAGQARALGLSTAEQVANCRSFHGEAPWPAPSAN